LWGTSYAGGHAIVLGATDRRLRGVVAQVPTISGAAYERALQPKKLRTVAGGHFDPYLSGFNESSAAARAWFAEHLEMSNRAGHNTSPTSRSGRDAVAPDLRVKNSAVDLPTESIPGPTHSGRT
jgi:hypothetical protein